MLGRKYNIFFQILSIKLLFFDAKTNIALIVTPYYLLDWVNIYG